MTEAEWLVSEDPGRMLFMLTGRGEPMQCEGRDPQVGISARKLRLFACGCARLCWPLLTDHRSRKAVEVAERYADGLATAEEAFAAWRRGQSGFISANERFARLVRMFCSTCCINAADAARAWVDVWQDELIDRPARELAALLRDVCGSPFRPVRLEPTFLGCRCPRGEGGPYDVLEDVWYCRRCGHPARTERQPWLTPTVVALAHVAYAEGREVPCGRCGGDGLAVVPPSARVGRKCPDCKGSGRVRDGLLCDVRLGVLSDALEEAGCREEALLRHLRGRVDEATVWAEVRAKGSAHALLNKWPRVKTLEEAVRREAASRPPPGPHARGCHVVDFLLGKE
jgi:hypothetical protein